MHRLICAFVVCKWQNRLWCGSNFNLRCSQQVGYCSVNARVRNVATLDLVRDVIIAAESFYAARTLREERYNGVVLQKLSVCQFNILLLEESICCGNGLKDVQSTKGIFYEGITFRKKTIFRLRCFDSLTSRGPSCGPNLYVYMKYSRT